MHRYGSLILVLLALAAGLAGLPAEPERTSAQTVEKCVTVVAESKYYVTGAIAGDEMQLFQAADPKRMWKVDGFIFQVIQPAEHAGQLIGMHHDGVLASGNPYRLWEIGRRYEFQIPKENIGKLSFGPCSVHGTRKVLAR